MDTFSESELTDSFKRDENDDDNNKSSETDGSKHNSPHM